VSGTELDRLVDEINQQPAVVQRLLDAQLAAVREVTRGIQQRDPSAVVFVGRGSSDNAAIYGRYLLEVCNRRLTSLAAPSGLTLYGRGPRLERTVVIGVSQSGQGEDVIAYVREARSQGAMTVAIVNDPSSPLAEAAGSVLECMAGPEQSIPATKTVTAQMTLLAMLSVLLDDPQNGRERLSVLPDSVHAALQQRAAAAALAHRLVQSSLSSVIGRGFAFPPALEIALKFKETSYTRAEPFSAADFLHGPIALVEPDYSALLIDVGGRSTQSALSLASSIGQRGGHAALLRAGMLQPLADDTPAVAVATAVDEPFAPIPALVLGQLLAIELALALGLDPAVPRGLRKVTSTR
jgi:glucosamine--fructose-6-phosphate aminotransferase (isomerizing)